ncbi:MAG TPA: hypothetical protein P5119_01265 [Candidatus Aminicenantes bacterium]|nr:hypothetical protein [Candidatus Aminicenantes bacterium]HRY63954.1 hypothetical protein [Candidatus Aminicenantes bacterium]HRZ70867.1 hypothetical protein [Candidatus Aminicenantes bacterium]
MTIRTGEGRAAAGGARHVRKARGRPAGAPEACPACGRLVGAGGKACPACGADIDAGAVRKA